MSNALAKYLFEGSEVRVVLDARGEPWFVAADVCRALGISNNRDAVARLDDDERGVATTDTPGGAQQVGTVSEAGVYRLVFTSRVEGAERFKRWLAHEVLPSIRKTGSYTAPAPVVEQAPALTERHEAARIHLDTAKALAEIIPGLNVGIAVSVALDAIHRDTGLTMEPYRALLPARTGPVASLNATAVGKALGVSARKANLLLSERGLQRKREAGGWEVTEEGAKYGEMRPFTRNGHSDYQPLWSESVVEVLRGGK